MPGSRGSRVSLPSAPAFALTLLHPCRHLESPIRHGNASCFASNARRVAASISQQTGPVRTLPFASERQPPPRRPGTTSLLLEVSGTDRRELQEFVESWLRDYVFAASSPLPVPTSVAGCSLLFYASDGAVRGELVVDIRPLSSSSSSEDGPDGPLLLRVTSFSRFLNRGGLSSASLPGERRLIRRFYGGLTSSLAPNSVLVRYKPAHIRLGAPKGRTRPRAPRSASDAAEDSRSSPDFGVVLVARIVAAPVETIRTWIARWGVEQQFSGATRTVRGVVASSAPLADGSGVVLRVGRGGREVVVKAKMRWKGSVAYGTEEDREGKVKNRRDVEAVHVSVLTNAPDDRRVKGLLERIAQDLAIAFLETRIHYPK